MLSIQNVFYKFKNIVEEPLLCPFHGRFVQQVIMVMLVSVEHPLLFYHKETCWLKILFSVITQECPIVTIRSLTQVLLENANAMQLILTFTVNLLIILQSMQLTIIIVQGGLRSVALPRLEEKGVHIHRCLGSALKITFCRMDCQTVLGWQRHSHNIKHFLRHTFLD